MAAAAEEVNEEATSAAGSDAALLLRSRVLLLMLAPGLVLQLLPLLLPLPLSNQTGGQADWGSQGVLRRVLRHVEPWGCMGACVHSAGAAAAHGTWKESSC